MYYTHVCKSTDMYTHEPRQGLRPRLQTSPGGKTISAVWVTCEDLIGTGPPEVRAEIIYVDLGYRAIPGSMAHPF